MDKQEERKRKIRKVAYMCISEKLCENKNAKESPCLETIGNKNTAFEGGSYGRGSKKVLIKELLTITQCFSRRKHELVKKNKKSS